MKRPAVLPLLLMAAGTALAGWGFFAPMVRVPIAGSLRYSESHLGGPALAWIIIALFTLSLGSCAFSPRFQRVGCLCFGAAIGLAAASLLSIYRGTMDQLEMVADPKEIQSLLARTEAGPGLFALVFGIALLAFGLIWNLCHKTHADF